MNEPREPSKTNRLVEEVVKLKCFRCGNVWVPKDPERPPKVCPNCKSTKWDEPPVETDPAKLPAADRKRVEAYLKFCEVVDPSRVRAIQRLIESEVTIAEKSSKSK